MKFYVKPPVPKHKTKLSQNYKPNTKLFYFYKLLTHFISHKFCSSIREILSSNDIKNDYNFVNKINGLDLNNNNNKIINKIKKI